MNQEQYELLLSDVTKWNKWRKENPDKEIELAEADLQGADLQYADLQGAYLLEANLQGAGLRDADLQGAVLQLGILQGAELHRANLHRANLQNADLRDAFLRDADLQDANLHRANLQNADLRDTDLQDADLQDADLRDADLRDANLRDANLLKADLRNAKLQYANLQGADLRNTRLEYAVLQNAVLQNTFLRDAFLQNANLQNANLLNAKLQYAKLQGADLQGANLNGVDLKGVDLKGVDLEGVDLEGVDLEGVRHWRDFLNTTSTENLEIKRSRDEITQLHSQLKQAKSSDKKNTTALQEKLKKAEDNNAALNKRFLDNSISNALKAIKNSMTSTENDVKNHNFQSRCLLIGGAISYLVAVIYSGSVAIGGIAEPEVLKATWVIKIAPTVLLFSIGTALLRHDAKIRTRYEHIANKKHTLDKASGVLDSSIELSKIDSIGSLHPIVLDTFNKLSAYLLTENETDKATNEPRSEEDKAIVGAIGRHAAKLSQGTNS